MSKILILTSKTGGGHTSLAEALADRLPQHQIEIIDPQPSIVHWHYRLVSRHALWLWGAEFRLGDTPARALGAHKFYTALLSQPLQQLFDRVQPDLIITTYSFLTYEVMQVMAKRARQVPLVIVLADPNGVHQVWLTEKGAAVTLAPTIEDYHQALAAGFDPERLQLSGWLVRDQFYRTDETTRPKILRELKLEPHKFTAFLQGGGEGAAKFAHTVENILALKNVQVILATGTNQALAERFRQTENVRALPFTKQIAPYMAAAEVIMGKAGPNMLMEAVTLGKPFIATAYIPGQEAVNLEFIERHQLGWCALTAAAQRELIESLVHDPAKLKAKDDAVEKYRKWNNERVETIIPRLEKILSG